MKYGLINGCIDSIGIIALFFLGDLCYQSMLVGAATKPEVAMVQNNHTVYQFELPGIDGKPIKLADFKGKVLLIVNTAAKCGFKGQYKELEELYQTYKEQGLVVIAVSSNDFKQEITDAHARGCALDDIVQTTFTITDMTHVIDRKGEYQACPLYQWLNEQGVRNSWFGLGAVQWNFHKFLIGRSGEFIDWFAATTSPKSKKVTRAIERALKA